MARNLSSRFTLDEGFDQQIEELHGSNSEENKKNSRNTTNAENTDSVIRANNSKSINSVSNTNSAISDNVTISTMDKVTADAEAESVAGNNNAGKNTAASFDPAAESAFIAKSCLYDDSKTKRITIQFNRDIYDYIKRESRIRGLSINNFVRMIITSYMSVPGNKHYVDVD